LGRSDEISLQRLLNKTFLFTDRIYLNGIKFLALSRFIPNPTYN
jgi:hypothetical protein